MKKQKKHLRKQVLFCGTPGETRTHYIPLRSMAYRISYEPDITSNTFSFDQLSVVLDFCGAICTKCRSLTLKSGRQISRKLAETLRKDKIISYALPRINSSGTACDTPLVSYGRPGQTDGQRISDQGILPLRQFQEYPCWYEEAFCTHESAECCTDTP